MLDMNHQLRKEFYEEFEEDRLELEDSSILNELNKTYNRKGYTTSDYINDCQYN